MSDEQLTAQKLMTPHVVTIGMDDTLRTARQLFDRHQFHHLIVHDRGRPIGVLSDRDLLKHISPFVGTPMAERAQDTDTLKKRVHQIMTRKLVAVAPEATLAQIAQMMLDHKVSCLPVIASDDVMVGIVTDRDLVGVLLAQHLEETPGPAACVADQTTA